MCMKKSLLLCVAAFVFLVLPNTSEAGTTTIKLYPTLDGFNRLHEDDNQSTWSAARSYSGTLTYGPYSTDNPIAIRADKNTGKYRINRGSLVFDTSVIPDNALIGSTTLNLYKSSGDNQGTVALVVTSQTPAATTSIAKSDWQIGNYGTTSFARGALDTGQYTVYGLNSSGKNHINVSDYTIFGLLTDYDFDNTDPGSPVESLAFDSSEATGTSTDPYLEVTYTSF